MELIYGRITKEKMKEKHKKYIVVGKGENCNRCGQVMERRKHSQRPKQTWFYSEWDYCNNIDCPKNVQHYDKYKSSAWQEIENQENHLRDIKNETLF